MARLSRENAQLRAELSERKPTDAVSFQGMKTILEAKELLKGLIRRRGTLAQWGIPQKDATREVQELTSLGLVTYNFDNGMQPRYQMSERGYEFLLKLDAKSLEGANASSSE